MQSKRIYLTVLVNTETNILHPQITTPETEEAIKEKTKATIRCIPLDTAPEQGVCVLTGKPSTQRVLFARAY
jgi:prolyl-tRNA synthetase